jgi:hypothetical protein
MFFSEKKSTMPENPLKSCRTTGAYIALLSIALLFSAPALGQQERNRNTPVQGVREAEPSSPRQNLMPQGRPAASPVRTFDPRNAGTVPSPADIPSARQRDRKPTLPEGVERIEWVKPVREEGFDRSVSYFLLFIGSVYDVERGLPQVMRNLPVGTGNTVAATLTDLRFEPLTAEEREAVGDRKLPESIEPSVSTYTERKRDFAQVSFFPLRKNPTTGQLEKVVEFKLQTREIASGIPKASSSDNFSPGSKLASGKWFKVAVSGDGMHRITYEQLQEMGMDVNSINPRHLTVFGNGGGMLPQPNNAFRHDDLVQNPIIVVGEEDGSFDPGDHIVFYAKGPHSWVRDQAACGGFRHTFNIYDERGYYYVTADRGPAPRINSVSPPDGPVSHTVEHFVDHLFHERDLTNLIGSGRLWMGELFDIQTSQTFDFGISNIRAGSVANLGVQVYARSLTSPTTFSVRVNNTQVGTMTVSSVSGGYNRNAAGDFLCTPVQLNSGNSTVSLTYSKGGNPSAQGWLDYITIICTRDLRMAGPQMAFRDTASVGPNNIAEFRIAGASSSLRVWDVTDHTNPREMPLSVSGSLASFRAATDSLRQFIAFNGTSYLPVETIGEVQNQNLHGLVQADMVIVSHPDFLSEANRLADFHRSNQNNPLSVHVVTPEQIYNEFSSGAQDVTAIRDFMRMFYERSTGWEDMPRYLLLFGDASYDYKDRVAGNTNFVPSYQSVESLLPTTSFVSDDYFGLLDPNEGRWNPTDNDALDIGIGRFPVDFPEEARGVVDKIIRYEDINANIAEATSLCCAGGNVGVSPDWRNRITFVADDEDGNTHINQSDQLAVLVDTTYRDFNINKIYFDAYVQQSTPGGQRYPEVTRDINSDVNRGVLIMNYTGHGGEVGWAHERVLGLSDINNWTNADNLVAFVTATCEFARHDDPERVSAGELCLLVPDGGAIALFTTTRLVYSAPNFNLNRNFFFNLLKEQPWGEPTMGDVIRMTKVASGGSVNNRNFVLLGDPAQRLSYPLEQAVTVSVNGISVSEGIDTLSALQLVTVTGRLQTREGQPMTDFNGIIYPTVFDKPSVVSTLGNDPGSPVRNFELRNNILYKGKASVVNGEFSFQFMVPKDIAYNFGWGRISYYAEGMGINASGHFEDFVIGGSYAGAQGDDQGPTVRLFMNEESFVFGGTTDESPIMIALLVDSSGINTVGSGIGHDITTVHNGNTAATIVLNDFYEADLDSYQSGRVAYPFRNLPEGTHTLRFKAWDVHNNSSEAYTEFVVAESAEMALKHVLNYPNPFTTHTQFMFEHNQACNSLDVMVQVFTISGKLVKTIHRTIMTDGFRGDPIEWDGLDDYGQRIGRGVYVYNLRVTGPDGQKAQKTEKLVVLR